MADCCFSGSDFSFAFHRTRIILFLLAFGLFLRTSAFAPPIERTALPHIIHRSIVCSYGYSRGRSRRRLCSILKEDEEVIVDYGNDDEEEDEEECSIYNLDACLEEGKTAEDCCIDEDLERGRIPDDQESKNPSLASLDQSLKRFVSTPIVEVLLAALVLASSFLVGLGTLQSLPPIVAAWSKNGEIVISAIFTVEYFIRWKLSGFSAKHVVQPLAVIDLVAILPGLIKLVSMTGLVAVPPSLVGGALINLRILRILRLQRVLVDYETFSKFEKALGFNPSDTRPYQLQLARVVISIFTLLSVTAGLIYSAEHIVNPAISDYFTALYFTEITLTTVGFGDVYPVTPAGKWIVGGSILVGSAVIPAQAAALVEALLDRQGEQEDKVSGINGNATTNPEETSSLALQQDVNELTLSSSILGRMDILERKMDETNARLDRMVALLEDKLALEEEELLRERKER